MFYGVFVWSNSPSSLCGIIGEVEYFDEDLISGWAWEVNGLERKGRVVALNDGVVEWWVGKNPLASLLARHLSVCYEIVFCMQLGR